MSRIEIIDGFSAASDHFKTMVRIANVDGPDGFRALAYKCLLNEDNDGAPNCYGPIGHMPAPLDALRNGTNNENHVFSPTNHAFLWHGLYAVTKTEAAGHVGDYNHDTDAQLESSDHKFPVVQRAGIHAGFYVSTTSWIVDNGLNDWDPAKYLNAAAFPYAAITPPLRDCGVRLGDLGLAIWPEKRMSQGFFFGDAGAQNKVGEVSRNLFRTFFPTANQEGHFVTFIVFPKVAAGTIHGPDLKAPVTRQISKLSKADNPEELVHFLAFPDHTGRIPIETRPADGSMSEMEKLRDALRTPYQREYLNTMWVLKEYGLTVP